MLLKLTILALAALDLVLAAPRLRQATRDQVVRISQTRQARREATPIVCGDGQFFTLTYNVTGSDYDGMLAVVGVQPDRTFSSSYTMRGVASTAADATLFTLDGNCDLVTQDGRHANVVQDYSSIKLYFDPAGGYGGYYPVVTCSVTPSSFELMCGPGRQAGVLGDSFSVCPSVSPSTYFYRPPIPGNCLPVTLTATPVTVIEVD